MTADWSSVRARVDDACRAAGRPPRDVALVAVSKFHSAEAVVTAFEQGARHFGESRVDELLAKQAKLVQLLGSRAAEIKWHFVGALQSRKIRKLPPVHLVHSIDGARQLAEFAKKGRSQDVLVQLNTSGEAQKRGVAPSHLSDFVDLVLATPSVRLRGLMCLPTFGTGEAVSTEFELTSSCLASAARRHPRVQGQLDQLSMGMSGDFAAAIACGATIVRVGTAIFGEREA